MLSASAEVNALLEDLEQSLEIVIRLVVNCPQSNLTALRVTREQVNTERTYELLTLMEFRSLVN